MNETTAMLTTTSEPETTTRVLYPTVEEAKAGPGTDKMRVFTVLLKGEVLGYAKTSSVDGALVIGARAYGMTTHVTEPKTGGGPVTKAAIAGKLAEFSDEELAELGLKRKPAKKAA